RLDGVEDGGERTAAAAELRVRLLPLEVLDRAAGGERTSGARHHHRAHGAVRGELRDRSGQRFAHLVVDGVQRIGAIQRERADPLTNVEADGVAHRVVRDGSSHLIRENGLPQERQKYVSDMWNAPNAAARSV